MQIVALLIYSVSILIAGFVLPGIVVDDFGTAIITAIVLGIVTVLIKPFLIILTLPINVLTLGLFTFVVNAILVLIAGAIVPGFEVGGVLWAIIFGIVVSIVNSIITSMTIK